MKSTRRIWSLLVLALIVALTGACGGGEEPAATSEDASTTAAPAPAAAPAGGGAVTGVVVYSNGDPDTAIAMDADPVCASLHGDAVHTEKIVADNTGNLANAFVYVKEGLTGSHAAPAESHVLDQMGCQYHPHVSGMMVGQKLLIKNSDPTLHNVHAMPTLNKEFNKGQPFQGMEFEHTFDQEEVMVRFKCDVHPWMSSYMAVVDHPFFGVTGTDGTFSIEGLPPGDYVIESWHEELGTKTANVTVTDGGTAEVSFDYSPAG
jgi:plastocyanin